MMLDQRGRDAAEQLRRYAIERARGADFEAVRRVDRRRRIVSAATVVLVVAVAIVSAALLVRSPFTGEEEAPVVTQPTVTTVTPTTSPAPATTVPSTTVTDQELVPAPLLSPEAWERVAGMRNLPG